jgi:hypothetical protein
MRGMIIWRCASCQRAKAMACLGCRYQLSEKKTDNRDSTRYGKSTWVMGLRIHDHSHAHIRVAASSLGQALQ